MNSMVQSEPPLCLLEPGLDEKYLWTSIMYGAAYEADG